MPKLAREDEVFHGDAFTGTKVEAGGNLANEHALGFINRHVARHCRLNKARSYKAFCNQWGDTQKIPVVKLVRHGSRNEVAAYFFMREECHAAYFEARKLQHATLDMHKTMSEMFEHRKMFHYDRMQVILCHASPEFLKHPNCVLCKTAARSGLRTNVSGAGQIDDAKLSCRPCSESD